MANGRHWTRREFVRFGALAPLSAGLLAGGASVARAATPANAAGERTLSFYNLHTDERLRTVYWSQGAYVPDALSEINHLLRDFRTNTVKPIHVDLLELLHRLSGSLATSSPFEVISGYRTAATNALLRRRSEGVARNSLHMQAMAIDIRVPGRALADLRRAAVALRGGGVGFYPASDFVHVDVGRVRYW